MKISVICVYNDEEQYQNQLVASLKRQNCEFELIGVNNTQKAFPSAASALNSGAMKSSGDILIFSHQDIALKGADELLRFAEAIENRGIGCVIGTQGAKYPSRDHISNITSGKEFNKSIKKDYADRFYEVECVDEGFFGMRRETWEQHHFDEIFCDNWHLYCVECCLYAMSQKKSVFVYPIQLHHFSRGRISISYMNGLKDLCRKYRKQKHIWTTCYKVYTSSLYINTLILIWKINRKMRGKSLT